ncbi:hypothetical protein MHU86_3534 [Fragilaria crotonensis]|nr:hypothetical protein MHU86_3534 [Fragilaria crotonensis]
MNKEECNQKFVDHKLSSNPPSSYSTFSTVNNTSKPTLNGVIGEVIAVFAQLIVVFHQTKVNQHGKGSVGFAHGRVFCLDFLQLISRLGLITHRNNLSWQFTVVPHVREESVAVKDIFDNPIFSACVNVSVAAAKLKAVRRETTGTKAAAVAIIAEKATTVFMVQTKEWKQRTQERGGYNAMSSFPVGEADESHAWLCALCLH